MAVVKIYNEATNEWVIPKNGMWGSNFIDSSSPFLDVTNMGVVPDSEEDQSVIISDAIKYAHDNGIRNVYIPKGTYMIQPFITGSPDTLKNADGGINLLDNTNLIMHPQTILKSIPHNRQKTALVKVMRRENVKIIGGQIVGERYEHTGTGGEWGHGILVEWSKNVMIADTKIRDFWGDGIDVGTWNSVYDSNNENIVIMNVESHNNRRQGLTIGAAIGVRVINCRFTGTNGTLPSAGVDIEPWAGEGGDTNWDVLYKQRADDIIFDGCVFTDNDGAGIVIMRQQLAYVGRVQVLNSYIRGNRSAEGDLSLHSVERIHVDNCEIEKYAMSNTTDSSIVNSKLEYGIVNNVKRILFSENVFENVGSFKGWGMMSFPFYAQSDECEDVRIINNVFRGSVNDTLSQFTEIGINISSGHKFIIKGNTFDSIRTAIGGGSDSHNYVNNPVVKDNVFINCGYAVDVKFPNTHLIGNKIEGTPAWNFSAPIDNTSSYATGLIAKDNLVFRKPVDEMYDRGFNYPTTKVLADETTSKTLLNEGNHYFDN